MTWQTRGGVKVWAGEPFPEPFDLYADIQPQQTNHRASPRADICGTVSGYQRHNRDRTTVCWDCRDAKREYDRELYARRKEAS